MTYELEKSLAVQKALVADLDVKNRRLREVIEDSDRKHASSMERLTVAESTHKLRTHEQERSHNQVLGEAQTKLVKATHVYKERLLKLTDELATIDIRCSTAEEKSRVLALEVSTLKESLFNDSKESKKQIDELDASDQRCTAAEEESRRLTLEVTSLKESLFNDSKDSKKQIEGQKIMINTLVDENQSLKAETREASAKYSRLLTRVERLKDRGHVMTKLERVLDSFE